MNANLDKLVSSKLTEEIINAHFGTFNQHWIRAKPVTMFDGDLCKLDFKSLPIIGKHKKQKNGVYCSFFDITENACKYKQNK